MKTKISLLLGMLLSMNAGANGYDHARAYIVVQDVQNKNEFFIERVPVVGCHVQPFRPHVQQLTSDYKVPSSRGCGLETSYDNVNALTCAKILEVKESKRDGSIYAINLDLSGCEAKNNPRFITTVRRAIALNFPQKSGQLNFKFVK
jgi:hypothetical protein